MTEANNPYLLPRRNSSTRDSRYFQPKSFKRLIEGLPLGDVDQLSKNIHQLLKQMNALDIPVTSRFLNLETLLKPLLFALTSLGKGLSRETLPLGKRATQIAELRERLCILAVQGYKVVLDQYHHDSFPGYLLHKPDRAAALHRVLYFLGQNLLQNYQLYRPARRFLWREIHGIHRYAVDQKLDRRMVVNEEPELVAKSSANDLYKQLLLLSLSGPYRLLQGELAHVYQALFAWAPQTQLYDLGKTEGDEGPFIIDISIDEPPHYRGAERDSQILKGWILDTSELAKTLAGELEQIETPRGIMRPTEVPGRLSPDLLARLTLSLGIGSKRVAERSETLGAVEIIRGLDAIYNALGGEPIAALTSTPGTFQRSPASARARRSPISPGLLEADEYVIHDDPQLEGLRESILQVSEPGTEKLYLQSEPLISQQAGTEISASTTVLSKTCPLFNRSNTGYRLGWSGGQDEQITVGELVAIVSPGVTGQRLLQLGVIRWMRADRCELIDFGVELLMGELKPVIFYREWGRQLQKGQWPGLLLQLENDEPTLITSPFYTEENDKTWLIEQGVKNEVHLSREIEATASFVQFYCRRRPLPVAEVEDADISQADFEKLWSHL